VFSDDQIDAYIELKWEEVMRWETTPSPVEFDMYYSPVTITRRHHQREGGDRIADAFQRGEDRHGEQQPERRRTRSSPACARSGPTARRRPAGGT
jgi:hypothetical protein